ncbi:MAG: phage tail protein [Lachnospiraceae bacterium]|jgi:phage tail-like protein|nr:phage tail protein [Lachnospiraceae bacterium]
MAVYDDLVMNNRFLVYINMNKLSFAKVSGIGAEMAKEIYAEGGENHAPHVLTTPKEQLRTLRFERGLQLNSKISDKMKPGMFIPYIEIIVKDSKGKRPLYEYCVVGAYVTKWEVSTLDAAEGNVMIETFEVEHIGIEKVCLG